MESIQCDVSLCPMLYSDTKKMREHCEDYHGIFPNTRGWKCEEAGCDKSFQTCYRIKRHYVMRHKKPYFMSTTQRCYKCNKILLHGQTVMQHLDKEHADMKIPTFRKFQCGICKSSYNYLWGLNTHARIQHNGLVNEVLLNFTSKDYARVCKSGIYHLNKHQDNDTVSANNSSEQNEKTAWLHCDICPLITKNKKDWDEHVHVDHNFGKWIYTCDSCNKPYHTKAGLKWHYKTKSSCEEKVTTPSEYRCSKCPNICFYDHSIVWRHIMKQHPLPTNDYNMIHACTICNIPFMTKRTLTIHKQKFHRDIANTETDHIATVERVPLIIAMQEVPDLNEASPTTKDKLQSTNSNLSKKNNNDSVICKPITQEMSKSSERLYQKTTMADKMTKSKTATHSAENRTSKLTRKRKQQGGQKIAETVQQEVTKPKKARITFIEKSELPAGSLMNGSLSTIVESNGDTNDPATVYEERLSEVSDCLLLDFVITENEAGSKPLQPCNANFGASIDEASFADCLCDWCGELVPSTTDYDTHVQKHEESSVQLLPTTTNDETPLVDCLCDLCGELVPNTTDYQEHLLTHYAVPIKRPNTINDEPPILDCLLCDICGELVSMSSEYKNHLQSHEAVLTKLLPIMPNNKAANFVNVREIFGITRPITPVEAANYVNLRDIPTPMSTADEELNFQSHHAPSSNLLNTENNKTANFVNLRVMFGNISPSTADEEVRLPTHQATSTNLLTTAIHEALLVECLCDIVGNIPPSTTDEVFLLQNHLSKPSLVSCNGETKYETSKKPTKMSYYENHNNNILESVWSPITLNVEGVSTHTTDVTNEIVSTLAFTEPVITDQYTLSNADSCNLITEDHYQNPPMPTQSAVAVSSDPIKLSNSNNDDNQHLVTHMVSKTNNDGKVITNTKSKPKQNVTTDTSKIQSNSPWWNIKNTNECTLNLNVNPSAQNLASSPDLSGALHMSDSEPVLHTGFVFKRHIVVKSRRGFNATN